MKRKKRMLSGLLCVLLLSGCSVPVEEIQDEKSTQASSNASPNVQSYRELILQLQQQLEEMREAQLLQATDYEREIAELEAVIAELEAASGSAQKPSDSEADIESIYTYSITGNGVVIQSYLGRATAVEIPAEIDGVPVVGIGEGAFRNSAVEKVVIPRGVQTIDWFAFYGSYRLCEVVLPSSVTIIEYGAFELCSSGLKFTCPQNSYAARYATSYGISVAYSNG